MTLRLSPINLGAPGEEISRKDLHAVTERFKHFNQGRLQRVREFLQLRQHDFLHLLPLLFHVNHPLLPGFISLDTPAGIPDYFPNKQTLDAAKQLSRGFVYKRKALRNYPVHALFLMGSVGSMAFSRDSDIDIWLCHQPGIEDSELQELKQKADLIETWAASLKLEVHFFLVNSEHFKAGVNTPISAESSGETQHYLLLEEFYRTSIYIAGRVPVWWLVPPQQESDYTHYVAHLLENRFISETDVLDFGGLQIMPVSEFVSATLWHIYKSLSSPHKALLKLFLMESYAVDFPNPRWLCLSLKQAIYSGDFSVDTLDPYLMIYDKVDDYLLRSGSDLRLSLARECFHIKIMGSTSSSLDNKARQMHAEFMSRIALRWQWPEDLLEKLGSQKFWDIKKACVEHVVIRDQLQQCLRMILKITGIPLDHPDQSRDLKLLSRKLRANLDLRPGKIEVLTTRSMVYVKPAQWTFEQLQLTDRESLWCLFEGSVTDAPIQPERAVKHSPTLIQLLCWMVVNGLYRRDLSLQLHAKTHILPNVDLLRLLAELQDFLSSHASAKETELNVYAKSYRLSASMLMVNLGEELAPDTNQEQLMMSERSDPLSYGENRYCFVQGIQRLSVSNWGEVTIQSYEGLEGIFSCLTELFNQSAQPLRTSSLRVVCYTQARGRSIALRIETIFTHLLKHFANNKHPNFNRYILPAGTGYCCFKWQNHGLGFYFLESNHQLFQELAAAQNGFSAVFFDDFVLEKTYIPFLYQQNRADVLQIFFHQATKHVSVYILDEKGGLVVCQQTGSSPLHVLSHYCGFIKNLQRKGILSESINIQCYEIQKNSKGLVSCQAVSVKPEGMVFQLRVKIEIDHSEGQVFFCNDRRFVITDIRSYTEVRNYILGFRKNREPYPFHITEIEVPKELLGLRPNEHVQSLHYLNHKHKVEEKLNSAGSL